MRKLFSVMFFLFESPAACYADGSQIDLLAGFIDDIQGMVVGDRRLLDFTIEDEAYADNLRGLQVVCDVTLKELFTWELPQVALLKLYHVWHTLGCWSPKLFTTD